MYVMLSSNNYCRAGAGDPAVHFHWACISTRLKALPLDYPIMSIYLR